MIRQGQSPDPTSDPDPSAFFRPLRDLNPPQDTWIGFWSSIRGGIEEAELGRAGRRGRLRAILFGSSAGLVVAAAVVAFAFFVLPVSRPIVPPASPGRTIPSPTRVEAVPPPVLENLRSASARVYTFQVGDEDDATDVILIVDEEIDL